MSDPTRANMAGRAYLGLRARARAEGRATDELLVLYVLERFLYRVSVSEHRDRLVLKGGMLLAALDQRRPTRDVDLLALGAANDRRRRRRPGHPRSCRSMSTTGSSSTPRN